MGNVRCLTFLRIHQTDDDVVVENDAELLTHINNNNNNHNNNRLEATFGVIAAAAPCIRPLLGHSSRSADYTSSKSRHGGLPLQSIRFGDISRFARREATFKSSSDEITPERGSDGGSQSQLWAQQGGRNIMKTTSVEIVTSPSDETPQ